MTVTPAMSLALTVLSGTASVDAATGVCCTCNSVVGLTMYTAVGIMNCKVSIMVNMGPQL